MNFLNLIRFSVVMSLLLSFSSCSEKSSITLDEQDLIQSLATDSDLKTLINIRIESDLTILDNFAETLDGNENTDEILNKFSLFAENFLSHFSPEEYAAFVNEPLQKIEAIDLEYKASLKAFKTNNTAFLSKKTADKERIMAEVAQIINQETLQSVVDVNSSDKNFTRAQCVIAYRACVSSNLAGEVYTLSVCGLMLHYWQRIACDTGASIWDTSSISACLQQYLACL